MNETFTKLTLVQIMAKYLVDMNLSAPLHVSQAISVECVVEGIHYEIAVKRKKVPKSKANAKMIPKSVSGS